MMAWPPPALPSNRTNATPQLDNHIYDHNQLALAMGDTTVKIQSLEGSTNASVNALWGSVNGHEGRIARTRLNGIALNGGLLIVGQAQTATTDANGAIGISFPQWFSGPALTIAQNLTPSHPVTMHTFDTDDRHCQVLVRWIVDGQPFINQAITFDWLAFGTRIPGDGP